MQVLLKILTLLFLVQVSYQLKKVANNNQKKHRHFLQQTVPAKERTETLYDRCYLPRREFYASQADNSQSAARRQTASQVGLDGDSIIYKFLSNDTEGSKKEIFQHIGGIIGYFIFVLLGFIGLLVLSLVTFCCIRSPIGCPPCQKLQSKVPYTNCQKKWPAAAVIVLSIILIASMIAIFVINPQLKKGYQDTRCSVAINFDDVLNGNQTLDRKSYFIGLKPLQVNLTNLKNNLQGIIFLFSHTRQNQAGKIMEDIANKISETKHELSDLAFGDNSQNSLNFSYFSPLNSYQGKSLNKVDSTFNNVLGNKHDTTSLIGSSYAGLSFVEHALQTATKAVDLVGQGTPSIIGMIQQGLLKYTEIINMAQRYDKDTDQKMQKGQSKAVQPISICLYIFASLTIIFALLMIVASVMMCMNRVDSRSRKLLYGGCFGVSVLGLLFFVFAAVMSAMTLGVHYGCNYVEKALLTKKDFKYRVQPVIKNQIISTAIAECVTKEGSGQIISQDLISLALGYNNTDSKSEVMIPNLHHILSSALDNANNISNYLSQINTNNLLHALQQSKKQLVSQISEYRNSQQLDLDSIENLQILEKLSNPSNYNCDAPGFSTDSWVPSTKTKDVFIHCKVKASEATKQTCSNEEIFLNRQPGCTGCIDTSSILRDYKTKLQVLKALNSIYPSPNCKLFNEELANVWNNYYKIKNQGLSGPQERAKDVQQKISQIHSLVQHNLEPNLKLNLNHLQQRITDGVTLPGQQMLKNLDCRVLGQNAQLAANTFCTRIFNYAYSMRILLIISGFVILALVLFAGCVGMRMYRTQEYEGTGGQFKSLL